MLHDYPAESQPWLMEIPANAIAKTARDEWEAYIADSVTEGGLLMPGTAAKLLDVHKSRPWQLLDAGKLTRFQHFGHTWISCRELKERLIAPINRGGRPKKS